MDLYDSKGRLAKTYKIEIKGRDYSIYRITNSQFKYAKTFYKPDTNKKKKIRFTYKNKFPKSFKLKEKPLFLGPTDLLYSKEKSKIELKGYTINSLNKYSQLSTFFRPSADITQFKVPKCQIPLRLAFKVASLFNAAFKKNLVFGRICLDNLWVSRYLDILSIGPDSFQLQKTNNKYLQCCKKGDDRFTSPEFWSRYNSGYPISPQQDLFGLAVLIFMILMKGEHPFDYQTGNKSQEEYKKRIQAGLFTYGSSKNRGKPRRNPAVFYSQLYPELKKQFKKTFDRGYQIPSIRTTTNAWKDILIKTLGNRCAANCSLNGKRPSINMINYKCPWCHLDVKILAALWEIQTSISTTRLSYYLNEKYHRIKKACKRLSSNNLIVTETEVINLFYFSVTEEVLHRGNYKEIKRIRKELIQAILSSAKKPFVVIYYLLELAKKKPSCREEILLFLAKLLNKIKSGSFKEAIALVTLIPFQRNVVLWKINHAEGKEFINWFIAKYT